MTMPRPMTYALLAAVLPGMGVMVAPQAAWADIQISVGTDLNGTVGALSTDTTANATTSNINIIQSKIDSLETQLSSVRTQLAGTSSSSSNYIPLQSRVTQLDATISALQSIVARLLTGSTITDYKITVDSSTLISHVIVTFEQSGASSVLTADIPALVDSSDTSDSSSGYDSSAETSSSSGGIFGGVDMLTQVLQQAGIQMMNQTPITSSMGAALGAAQAAAGGANPLSQVQNTLNSLVSGANDPVPAKTGASCKAKSGQDTPSPGVAVYDISAGKVYMPDGSVLDAHSGMGAMKDNPDFVNQRMGGSTPPNVYNLSMRESTYHGVEALRLTPTDSSSMYGRDGILAHSPLVNPAKGASHGCVAFTDYASFLAAFKAGQVQQLVVVGSKSSSTDGPQQQCLGVAYTSKNPGGTK